MTPAEIHTAVLAALAELERIDREATPAPWRWEHTSDHDEDEGPHLKSGDTTVAQAYGYDGSWGMKISDADKALIVAARNTLAEVYAGRRRILERHAPRLAAGGWTCDRHETLDEWPCVDYRDVAAGLPDLPEELR